MVGEAGERQGQELDPGRPGDHHKCDWETINRL